MKTLRIVLRVFLLVLLFAAAAAAFWLGVVPQRLSPFALLSLDKPAQWFIDPKLAALRRDREACRAVLKPPHIEAQLIPDSPIKNGCGWMNSVSVKSAGGAELGASRLTCEAAAALALWVEYEVQPLAETMLGSRVVRLHDMGTYDCRNMIGNARWAGWRSEHALANALDVGGFTLADGRRITVARNWRGPPREAEFLHAVHARACRYFRVAIGPDYNAVHSNHFHLDRGLLWRCR